MRKNREIKGGFNNNLPITIILIIIVLFIIFYLIYDNKLGKIKTVTGY